MNKAFEIWWCIYWPNTGLLPYTARLQRKEAIRCILDQYQETDWQKLYRRGLRCVKIAVTMVQPEEER